MKLTEAKERAEKLRLLINDYRYHYHVLDESIMTEAAADSLKHELSQIEAQYPELITSDSPTQRVAGAVSEAFNSIAHSGRMLSLNDVFNREEVEAWLVRVKKFLHTSKDLELFADLKMDGLACALRYKDGKLYMGLTRGDGTVGEDITVNVRTIDSIPLTLREEILGEVEIRGEIVMYKDDFDQLNKEREAKGLPLFANPRNTAAGAMRQLDPRLVAERRLKFHAYDIAVYPSQLQSHEEVYKTMKHLGFKINPNASKFNDVDELFQFIEKWDKKRESLDYNTDGVVVKLNDKNLYSQAGIVGKAPRGACAFKYPAEQSTSIVKDIVISIGRTGAATPVAVFDPVVVAGSTVQHASLHNADEIARKDVRVGDTVVIFKAGDIIPQVEKVLLELRPKNTRPFDFEAELKRQYPELEFFRPDGEAVYRVKGASGPIILKRAVEHYASKGALDIEGLGEKNVVALVDSGLVKNLADIYKLSVADVLGLERFADISANKLVDAIADAKTPPLAKFIFGLGIRHVGAQTAIDLAKKFESIDKLALATPEDLESIEGVGVVVAESILAWFADPDSIELLNTLSNLGVRPIYKKLEGKLSGKNFVITGTLEKMSRDQAADRIRALGGTFQTAVAKDTTYLVAGGKVGASKLKKAESYGTKIINETDFLELL